MTSLSIAAPVSAQIVPDNTLPVNSSVTPGCTTCIINGGTVRGDNLFHSFEQFSVPTNGTAWFNNAPQIQNILTRVTGGFQASNIDGLLKTNGSANLFLLNPNGITFGRNARLEIGGSFTATTATSFQFTNGTEFSTINPLAPPLLAVNLTQGLQYGPLSSASVIVNGANLNTPQSLKLFTQILDVSGQLQTGKDLTLEAAVISFRGQLQAGQHLTLQGSDISIYDDPTVPFSAQAGGNLSFQAAALDFNGFNRRILLTSGGLMSLSSDYEIVGDFHFVSGNSFVLGGFHPTGGATLRSPGGSVISAGGDIEMRQYMGDSLLIEAKGNIQIGSIAITPPFANNPFPFVNTDTVLATMPGVIIRSGQTNLLYHNNQTPSIAYTGSTLPMGINVDGSISTRGGQVFLTAPKGNVTLGLVETLGGDVLVQSAGGISGGFNTTNGANNGGNVTLIAQNGDLMANVDTSSSYYSLFQGIYDTPPVPAASGNGGNVTLSTVNGNIKIYDLIDTSSSSGLGDSGNGGNVTLSTVNGNIDVNRIDTFSSSAQQGTSGNGGNISLSTANGNIKLNNLIAC